MEILTKYFHLYLKLFYLLRLLRTIQSIHPITQNHNRLVIYIDICTPPVLPTTPFLLLAAVLFAKSSKRLHQWFVQTKLYQKHLDSFVRNREMTLQTKVRLLSFASIMILLAIYFTNSLHLQIFLLLLMFIKYYYFIVHIKTIR